MITALSVALQAGTPILAWGPPGVGKTAVITALAESLALPLEVVLASIREPADFSGLPVIREDGVKMEAPAWARRLAREGKGILFLDEISTAPPAVQAALLRVVLDRVVGDLELPPGVAVVAAANPPEQAAGGWVYPRRWRIVSVISPGPGFWSLDRWYDPGLAPPFRGTARGLQERVSPCFPLSWPLSSAPPHLFAGAGKRGPGGKAWPSPRSWEMAAGCWLRPLMMMWPRSLSPAASGMVPPWSFNLAA